MCVLLTWFYYCIFDWRYFFVPTPPPRSPPSCRSTCPQGHCRRCPWQYESAPHLYTESGQCPQNSRTLYEGQAARAPAPKAIRWIQKSSAFWNLPRLLGALLSCPNVSLFLRLEMVWKGFHVIFCPWGHLKQFQTDELRHFCPGAVMWVRWLFEWWWLEGL